MPEPQVEVRTELTLDDAASSVMDRIKVGFQELQKETRTAQSFARDFGTQFAATFAALNIMPLVHQAKELALSFIEVGNAAVDAERQTAGLYASMTGREWGVAKLFAEDLNDSFDALGISIGHAADDIKAGHDAIAFRLGATSRAFQVASDNMENLTRVAHLQGLSVAQLGSEFGILASGFVRMESPLTAVLRRTGIFSNDISKITAEWRKLTEEERIRRLEGAFGQIATNLRDIEPSLSDLKTSIGAIGEEFLESFGKSAMTEFTAGLGVFRGELQDNQSLLEDFAADVGRDVGQAIAGGVELLRSGLAFVREHADEIRDAIKEGFEFARTTVEWMIEHRKELMLVGGGLLAANTGLGGAVLRGAGGFLAGGAAQVATAASGRLLTGGAFERAPAIAAQAAAGKFSTAMGTIVASGGTAAAAGGKLATALGSLTGAVVAGGPPVWAATAAVAALTAGAVALYSSIQEGENQREAIIQRNLREFTELAGKMGQLTAAEIKRMDELQAQAERMAADKMDGRRVSDDFDAAFRQREEKILQAYVHPMQRIEEAVVRFAEKANQEGLFPEEMAAQQEAVNAAARLFQAAWQQHDESAQQYIANVLMKSREMREAFVTSADLTAEGFQHLSEVVRGIGTSFSEEFAQQLQNVSKAQLALEAKKQQAQINFNGGQVFKMTQNFRDQDPDQVVVSFQRKITQAAISRVQAVTATPFGT